MIKISEEFRKKYLKRYDKAFYKTYTWQKMRAQILERDNWECQVCKDKGDYGKANTVHHVKHYDKFPELGLTDNNLISVCMNCHNDLHPEKGFNKKEEVHGEVWE